MTCLLCEHTRNQSCFGIIAHFELICAKTGIDVTEEAIADQVHPKCPLEENKP